MEKQNIITITIMLTLLAITPIMAQGTASSVSSTSFEVFFPNATCIVVSDANDDRFPDLDLGISYWKEPGNDPAPSRTKCFIPDGINRDGLPRDTCCIVDETCNVDTGLCEFDTDATPGPFRSCGDYGNEDDCLRDSGHPERAAEELFSRLQSEGYEDGCSSINTDWSDLCHEFVSCACVWDDSDDTCKPQSNINYVNTNTNKYWNHSSEDDQVPPVNVQCSTSGPSNTGACTFEFTVEGDCSTGIDFVTRRWTATFENNADDTTCSVDSDCGAFGIDYYCNTDSKCTTSYCQPGSEAIACERVVRLRFFSTQNIIIAIIIIILIYWFRSKKKKK